MASPLLKGRPEWCLSSAPQYFTPPPGSHLYRRHLCLVRLPQKRASPTTNACAESAHSWINQPPLPEHPVRARPADQFGGLFSPPSPLAKSFCAPFRSIDVHCVFFFPSLLLLTSFPPRTDHWKHHLFVRSPFACKPLCSSILFVFPLISIFLTSLHTSYPPPLNPLCFFAPFFFFIETRTLIQTQSSALTSPASLPSQLERQVGRICAPTACLFPSPQR